MKTIKKRAESFAKGYKNKDLSYGLYTGYIVGAETQRNYDENLRTKKREAMTHAEYNRECAFIDWCFDNNEGTITHSDAIEWARKDLLDKACKWLEERDQCGVPPQRAYGFAEEFRKAMED